MAVRLFIGNLPYGATEADLRAHFAAVAEPSHIVMPVDRETGRPRGFAFVEFAERDVAEEVIKKFDAQPFQGRNLAVSEARAREDRPPPRPPRRWRRLRRPTTRWRLRRPRPAAASAAAWRRLRWSTARRRLRRSAPGRRRLRPPAARRPRSQRQLRPPAPPKRLRGAKKGAAAGTQAARPDQGAQRRPHLRRGRPRGRRAAPDRHRRHRDQRAEGRRTEDATERRAAPATSSELRRAGVDERSGRATDAYADCQRSIVEPLDRRGSTCSFRNSMRPSLSVKPDRRRQPASHRPRLARQRHRRALVQPRDQPEPVARCRRWRWPRRARPRRRLVHPDRALEAAAPACPRASAASRPAWARTRRRSRRGRRCRSRRSIAKVERRRRVVDRGSASRAARGARRARLRRRDRLAVPLQRAAGDTPPSGAASPRILGTPPVPSRPNGFDVQLAPALLVREALLRVLRPREILARRRRRTVCRSGSGRSCALRTPPRAAVATIARSAAHLVPTTSSRPTHAAARPRARACRRAWRSRSGGPGPARSPGCRNGEIGIAATPCSLRQPHRRSPRRRSLGDRRVVEHLEERAAARPAAGSACRRSATGTDRAAPGRTR